MMPGNVFQIELAARTTPRRSVLMRLGLPMLLALPFALAHMPPRAKSTGMVMLVLFLAFFGAAVTVVRRRTDGLSERLAVLPIPRWLVAADLLLAGACMDLAQLAGPVALLLAAGATNLSVADVAVIAGLTVAVVTLLNALGMALAAAMKGNPEVHLAGALAVGVLAMGSGLFPLPPRLAGVIEPTEPYNPISLLAHALARSVEGTFDASSAAAVGAAVVLASAAAVAVLRATGLPAARSISRENL